MEFVKTLLEEQPMFALFLTIAIGYVVGEINLKGFSLGVGAVLFVALATGWFAPKVGTLGLSLFLYAVGAQYGKQFFLGFSSAYGRRANLIALVLPGTHIAVVVHVRRGDADLLARPGLILEYGDRVGLLANPADFGALRTFFGNSIKGTAEFSYISIGLGMALGFLLGAVSIPLPGVGKIGLGLSGVLIVALIFGKLRRTGGLNWTVPLSANLVLRNLGLTLFLAQVGMASGPRFAATVADGPGNARPRRGDPARAVSADHSAGAVRVPHVVRSGSGHRGRGLRQSGHSGVCQQTRAH